MGEVEELLSSYKHDMALTQMYLVQKQHLLATITDAEKDEYIAGASVRRPPLDQIGGHSSVYSRTERLAIEYIDDLSKERRLSLKSIEKEIGRLEYRQSILSC